MVKCEMGSVATVGASLNVCYVKNKKKNDTRRNEEEY